MGIFYEIITVRLGYHKSCFNFDFSEQYHKDGDQFLNYIIGVTGDETWVSFLNETKEQSKQWIHTHSQNMQKSLNMLCLPEGWWQLFSVTEKGCRWWNSCNKGL
jgi:hypothetical protein